MTTHVLIADDHQILREGLKSLLDKEPDIEVIGEASNGRGAVALAGELKPDVVIMDVAMSDMGGIEATRRITAKTPGVKVIALSMHSDRRFVAGMLGAGALGYLLKDSAFDELARSIRAVIANEIYLSPGITGIVVQDYMNRLSDNVSEDEPVLTPREREVLQLLAEGNTTTKISQVLGISAKTVETHRKQVKNKLHLKSIAELTKYALRTGLTTLDG